MSQTDKTDSKEDPVKIVEKALEIPETIVEELPPVYKRQYKRLWDKISGDEK
ncbi:MAG: hypothetical protein ABEJ07_03825 [Candidatus Nanohaloarchaea archaeon]